MLFSQLSNICKYKIYKSVSFKTIHYIRNKNVPSTHNNPMGGGGGDISVNKSNKNIGI